MRVAGENWGFGARAFGLDNGRGNARIAESVGEISRSDGGNTVEADETAGVDSVGHTTGTASTLAIGASTNGFVNVANDRDWYAVSLVAGQSYSFTLNGVSLTDPYLEIYNSFGGLIGFDDDFGSGINSLLRWTATETGTYYINARSFPEGTGTGSYTLTAQTSAPASPIEAIDYHYTMPTTSISVWFSTPGYTNPTGDATLRAWTQQEIDAVMAALATYSAIAPLTFSVAASQATATWTFTLAELEGNTLGYFAVGSQYAAFDPNVTNFTAGLTPGGSSWVTLIHEAGHGLGMAHPHDNGAENYGPDNSEVMQGVTDPFGSLGTFSLNQGVFTTMTYNDGWYGSPFGGSTSSLVGGQATPMALDVALMQQRYGVNTTTGLGNTTYTLALVSSAYRAIWDNGGTDTISYAGTGSATIDLRAATLLNAVGGGGYVSFVQGVHGGWTIANGVLIENATSGSGADTLIGNDAANTLNGGAGVDYLVGGLGGDTYHVDDVGDLINEALSAGVDTVVATTTHTLQANVENLVLNGGGFEIHGSGNLLNNVITGDDQVNALQGFGGNDTLSGGGGNDSLFGGADVDSLDGGTGADTMNGGDGGDLFYVDNANDVVTELANQGTDTIYTAITYTASANVEALAALGAAAINLYGNALNNVIVGNGAQNTMDGGVGADTLIGSLGDDLYVIDDQLDVIIESAGEGVLDTIYTSFTYYQMGANVENTQITGGPGSYVVGNSVNNLLVGNAGADTFEGAAGADTLVGAAGDDFYIIADQDDVIIELAAGGNDTIYTSISFYQMGANVENLSMTGTGGTYAVGNGVDNLIVGNLGADTLDGGAGGDFMVGHEGDDLYFVDDLGDRTVESADEGTDAIYASINWVTGAHVENLVLTGTSNINGGGNALNNFIFGNSGANIITGGAGNDVLSGGGGADTFVYTNSSEGSDSISDFVSGVDHISISAAGFGGGLVSGGAAPFVSGSTPSAVGASFLYDTDDGRLFWDSDGAGGAAAILIATLSGAPTLTQSDIIIGP